MKTPCSLALLESALAGNLPAEEEGSLHRHLEECPQCSTTLEQMAGGPAWCRETAEYLKPDELDESAPGRSEWSEVDFTVEHLEPSGNPNVLGRLGGYDILEIIGHGGMGVVLKAYDCELKRCVAIKALAPNLAHSSLAKKRFAREAQAAAAVVHPHVLAIHHVQATARLPYFVMPLVAGESLAQRLKSQGPLELKEILRIGMQAAAGLAAAHDQGLAHRDVKPANILLEKGVERAVLTDFGLARAGDDQSLTRWGVIAGTPQYMSPEQAKGEPLDGRSDLFSLGCVLYEMACGVSPFRSSSAIATLRRLVDEAPPALASLNPELPAWFLFIVERLLAKDPSRRFGSAREVSELLEGCLAHLQQPANVPLPAGLPRPLVRPKSRRRRFIFVGVLAMLAIAIIALLMWNTPETQSPPPPDIAGQWHGDEWGSVVLKKSTDTEYTGTYTDTIGKNPGEIYLKWSRIEGRFNGTWKEGEDRFGELSVRLVGSEIRGALTTDAKSKINPATPRLADLTWARGKAPATNPSPGEFGGIAPDVVAAWKKAGAKFGWMKSDRHCLAPPAASWRS
jgi:serine/threonine-protein kinase